MLPLGKTIRLHELKFHCYTDLLLLSMKSDEVCQALILQVCLRDIKTCLTENTAASLPPSESRPHRRGEVQNYKPQCLRKYGFLRCVTSASDHHKPELLS